MRLVTLNNKLEAVDYGKNHRKTGDFILPIGPDARHYALENNWEIQTLGSLWTKDAYFKAQAESEQRIKILVEELNEYSKCVAKNFPLTIGHYFHFQLHVIVGQIHYNRFIINCIQQELKPRNWLIYNPEKSGTFMAFRPIPEKVFGDVFSKSPYVDNGIVVTLANGSKDTVQKSLKHKVMDLLPGSVGDALRAVRQRQLMGSFFNGGGKKLLLSGGPYDWTSAVASKEFKTQYSTGYVSGHAMQSSKRVDTELLKILAAFLRHNCHYSMFFNCPR
jgi:hypothetical protein